METFLGFSFEEPPYNFMGNEGIYSMGKRYKSC